MYQYCLLLKCDFQYASQVKQSGAQGQMTCTEDVTFSLSTTEKQLCDGKKQQMERCNSPFHDIAFESFLVLSLS